MITLYTLSIVLLGHWVFDFMLQTHWMATNKSKNNVALGEHVAVYVSGLCIIAFLNAGYFNNFAFATAWVIVNGVLHFLTDYVTSRATSLLYKDENYHDFFVTIGFDQLCHYFTLFATFLYFTKL